jgi:DNA-directed RNA polymerase specialized sigma24 family protein
VADAPVPPRTPLRPFLVPDLAVPAAAERRLAALARAAQAGDPDARADLWEELAPAIGRVVGAAARRARAAGPAGPLRDGRPWDAEDLGQEAFPIVVDLLAAWDGERPVVPYLLGHLPWRLRSVWRAMVARHRAEAVPPDARLRLQHLADGSAAADEAIALLEALAADLPPLDRAILLRHLRDGEPLRAVARGLGLDRRTVTRRWAAIKAGLRRED